MISLRKVFIGLFLLIPWALFAQSYHGEVRGLVVFGLDGSMALYNAWRQSILTIPAECQAVVETFNANDAYTRLGYRMNCQIYDLLTIEKYIEIASTVTACIGNHS